LSNNILFLTLKVFAATGGIEKVCRVAGKAFYESSIINNSRVQVYSMYDNHADADDNRYFPSEIFHGFGMKKMKFIIEAIRQGKKSNIVILSHINLIMVGWLIKKISPSTRIMLFAHGIEVWESLGKRKKMMLACCDKIIAVSQFTSQKLQELHRIPANKCTVLNNCLDPYLPFAPAVTGKCDLRNKYGYTQDDIILFTLTRLASKERYKGYDKVLQAMVALKHQQPNLKYLLAGSYDALEKSYLDELIKSLGLEDSVTIAGFIKEEDLVDHFSIANIYVMPSMKEGFGIVFIEAMYYGLPVIAGNKDGSVDALCNGKLGILVDPQDIKAIEKAIEEILLHSDRYKPDQKILMEHFSYKNYKIKLEKLIA
jgi:glycosyltransferase involved in cell wall biosynthesis